MGAMDIFELVKAELAAYREAEDKRAYVQERATKLFDRWVEPIDLPGPDPVIDPFLRKAVSVLAGMAYDDISKRLSE